MERNRLCRYLVMISAIAVLGLGLACGSSSASPELSYTSPLNNESNVSIGSNITATFTKPMNPSYLTTLTFTVTGPGTTPVSGTVSCYGYTATFNPTNSLPEGTQFTAKINSGVRDTSDTPLRENYTWKFTTGVLPDTNRPRVSSTFPANGAVDEEINRIVTVAFSESMEPSSINSTTFRLVGPSTTPVLGTVAYVGITATFSPADPLPNDTLFTATVTSGARDLAGNTLETDFVWTFMTAAFLDIIPPTVSSTTPMSYETEVPINSMLTASFSEAMDPMTVSTDTFTVTGPGTTPVLGTVAYVGLTATFTPTGVLPATTVFTATISTGAKDLAGNPLAVAYEWTFISGEVPDIIPPTVSSTYPPNAATGQPINRTITVAFSEEMDPLTISTATFRVVGPSTTPVLGTVTYIGVMATFTPSDLLPANTLFTVTVTSGAKDLAGHQMETDYVWTFMSAPILDTTPPTVSSTVPTTHDTEVPINTKLTASFSEAMDPMTVSTATFTVTGPGTTPVLGTVAYVGQTATFTPANALAASTFFTATITTGAEDLAGNPLAVAYEWTFISGEVPDVTPPAVSSTFPADAAIGQPINRIITAVFSEEMDPLKISTATFRVIGPSTTPVRGTVTYTGVTATFTPRNLLPANTLFTATVTSGAKDLAGHQLETDYVWTFMTAATLDTTPPTVSSTIPTTNDTEVPTNTKLTASFSEAMDPMTVSTATFTVTGPGTTPVPGSVAYVGRTATFTPTNALAGSTSFTATIATGAEDLAGNPLAVAYAWTFITGEAPDTAPPTVSSTFPADASTGQPINGIISAVFSEEMDPLTVSTATFRVTGPSTTPVLGTVTYIGVTASFAPLNLLPSNTLFTATVTSGAKDLAGHQMATDYVWTFSTGAASDTAAPTVSSTTPVNSATGVSVNSKVTATFSEVMNSTTVSTATFTVTGPGTTAVLGTVTYTGVTATFTPTNTLANDTSFTATVTTGAEDTAGNPLAADYVWTFSTGVLVDTVPPTITSTVPNDMATSVAINSDITATFSEAMDSTTITTTTFLLTGPGTTAVTGTVTYVGFTATFAPTSDLAYSTEYTATVTTGADDLAGNALAANYTWTFTTGVLADAASPTVSETSPVDLAVGVDLNSDVTATFSEGMDPLTITTTTFLLTGPGTTAVAGTVTYAGFIATFAPTSDLDYDTEYTATVTTGAEDLAGNALVANEVWTFTTPPYPVGPSVVDLGTSGNFVLLCKSGISTTGTTSVTGDLGISPVAQSFFTGFSEVLDSSNQFALATAIVTGKLYAADMATPTPSNLTTAISDLEDAYTDAAGRPTPDYSDLGSGDISGMTLTGGLYKWSSGVSISASGVTLSGGPNDTWVFQISGDLTVASSCMVTLTGGALPQNVYWQVAGQVVLGSSSNFKGIILCQTQIVFQTGASFTGRALAQTGITLDAATIVEP